jgi:hypothetical protein
MGEKRKHPMTIKPRHILIALAIVLAACGQVTPQEAEMTKAVNTAFAIVQTGIALTQTAAPTATPTNTPTALLTATTTPTLIPTQPSVPIITPDTVQVERWKEIEKELAKNILPMNPIESVICEWDILGNSEQKVYVYAICASLAGDDSFPVVIHFRTDGSIHNMEIPRRASEWFPDINRMFPVEIQAKFRLYTYSEIYTDMLNHLRYRFNHPEEPPLVILSATPTP